MAASQEQIPPLRQHVDHESNNPQFTRNISRGAFLTEEAIANIAAQAYSKDMEIRIAKLEVITSEIRNNIAETRADIQGLRSEVSALRLWIAGAVLTIIGVIAGFVAYQASWFQHSLSIVQEQAKVANEKAQKTMDSINATMLRLERLDAEYRLSKEKEPSQAAPVDKEKERDSPASAKQSK